MSNAPTDGPNQWGGEQPPSKSGGKKAAWIIGGVIALLVLVGAGLVLSGVLGGDGEGGEVFLSPAADVGPDPYSATPLAAAPDPALAQPVSQTDASISGSGQTSSANGSTPGLYGGTMNMAACDPLQVTNFLVANPDKAAAWVAALNEDPTVALPDGRPLTVDLIPEYIASLTPVVLMNDTRVTNHGYKNGEPTSLQSTLQKGTAVLVDVKGVLRVKCYCGNPLTPAKATAKKPVYTGPVWPDFQPAQVSVVQQSTTVINVFVLTDYKTGQLFDRPAGTTGAADVANTPGATTTVPPTTAAPTTAAPTTVAPTTAAPTTAAPTTTAARPNCSRDSTDATDMTIVNNTGADVEIVYINPSCAEESITTLAAGDTTGLNTYVGHAFVAKSGGSVVSTFEVTGTGQTWSIN